MSEAKEVKKATKPKALSPVDLVTIAAFAVMYRLIYYVARMFGIVFPYNMALVGSFSVIAFIPMMVIIRKPGAAISYTILWNLINIFFQGEVLLFLLTGWLPGAFSEIYGFIVKDWGTSLRHNFVHGFLYGLGAMTTIWFVITYIFDIVFPAEVWLSVVALGLVLSLVFTAICHPLGLLLRKVIVV